MSKYLHLFTSKHPELHKALEHVKMGGEEAGHVSHSMALEEHGSEADNVPKSHNKGPVGGEIAKGEKAHLGDHDADDDDDEYQSLLNKNKGKGKKDCY